MLRRDLSSPAWSSPTTWPRRRWPTSRRRSGPLRFVRAGGDLLIVGDAGLVDEMARAVRQRVAGDASFARKVERSATRVIAMKARRGLVECSA